MQKSYFFIILISMVLGGVLVSKADAHLQSRLPEGGPQKEEKLAIQEGSLKIANSSYSSTIKTVLKAHSFSFPKNKLVLVGKAGLGVAAAWATVVWGIEGVLLIRSIFNQDLDYFLTPGVVAFLAGGPTPSWLGCIHGYSGVFCSQ